jgi:hypothetical protein
MLFLLVRKLPPRTGTSVPVATWSTDGGWVPVYRMHRGRPFGAKTAEEHWVKHDSPAVSQAVHRV